MAKKNNGRIDLSKDDELMEDVENVGADAQPVAPGEDGEATEPVIPVEGVNPPQPEVPASVQEPNLSKAATDKAIEYGPEEPKKKGFAWLWALIGIAIVLAFLGWVFLKKGDKTDSNTPEQTEESVAVADSVNEDSVATLPSEINSNEGDASDARNSNEVAENGTDGSASVDNGTISANSSADNAGQATAVPANQGNASAASMPGNDLEAEAMKVIRGEYGNNPVRRNNLGSKYQEIQSRVNELKRTGKF